MNHELEKCMRIITDLVFFCHFEGAEHYAIDLDHSEDGYYQMRICCDVAALNREDLVQVAKALNQHRQREMEQNYWELSGETESSGELTLVGMMTDKAKVEYEDGKLTILLWRKEE